MKSSPAVNRETPTNIVQTRDDITAIEQTLKEAQAAITVANRMSKSILFSLCVNILLACALCFSIYALTKQKTVFLAVTEDGKIIELYPTDEPPLTNEKVKLNTRDSLNDVLNLNFDIWRSDMERGRKGFDDKGFADVIKALKDGGYISIMEKERVNLRTEFGPAVITAKGHSPQLKSYIWIVEYPITVSFVGQNNVTKPTKLTLITTVRAVDPSVKVQGSAITQVVTKPRN